MHDEVAAPDTETKDPGPVADGLGAIMVSAAGLLDSLRLNFLAGLWFLAWLVGQIGEQVSKGVTAADAGKHIELVTAIGIGGLYLLIAGGIMGLMGSLIAGPNPLAVIAEKALDKLKN